MRKFFVFFFIYLLSYSLFAQENKAIEFESIFSTKRLAAEWESVDLLVLVWKSYYEPIAKMAHFAQDEVDVLIVCSDSNQVLKYFRKHNYNTSRLQFSDFEINSVWIRDYGPLNIYLDGSDDFALVDFRYNRKRRNDDNFPLQLALTRKKKILQIASPSEGLFQIGGNFMTNGLGTAFSTALVLHENAELKEQAIRQIFRSNLGINEYILFDTLSYDIIHHIDMHMKLIDEETILVGKFPDGVGDQPIIDNNICYLLNNYNTIFGKPYNIVEIPMPDDFGRYPDSTGWADYLTYTNSLILNQTVFVPIYGIASDAMALAIYAKHFPAYRIIGINVDLPIRDGGAVHCFTYSLSSKQSRNIWLEKPVLECEKDSVLKFSAYVNSTDSIKSLQLYFKLKNQEEFQRQELVRSKKVAHWFELSLPILADYDSLQYFLQAYDASNHVISDPITAPKGYYSWAREEKSVYDLTFFADTLYVKSGTFSLSQFLVSPPQDFIYYWTSDNLLKIKNLNSLEATVRFPMLNKENRYSFRLLVSDGMKFIVKHFYVQIEK